MKQWRKDIASWTCGGVLYLSVPFTWLLGKAEQMARAHKGKVVAGGPAVKLMGAPWADETPDETPFDVLAMHNPCATFTTRGCPNRCAFCAVPKIEGELRELKDWKPAPTVCDNNLLAASLDHIKYVVAILSQFLCVDFNQGLDARLFKGAKAEALSRLNIQPLRFAFDSTAHESHAADAVALAKQLGFRDVRFTVLIGYKDTPTDAQYRLEKVRSWGCWTLPMRYQPLDAMKKNAYVAPGWTHHELCRMSRYYFRLGQLGSIPYDEYQYTGDDTPLLAAVEEQK